MAVTPADLMSPEGPVEKQLFPGEGDGRDGSPLEERLTAYIAQAEAKVTGIAFPDEDAAVEAWALHLTFHSAYVLALARPANRNFQEKILGSEAYEDDQREALKALSDFYAAQYEDLLLDVPAEGIQPKGPPTRSVTNVFDW